ncbi:MAG TPA: hypothetical protein VFR41_10290, partial [Acidimicrobiia bacterium]|nr:hypothetical protein [Acidimicrobiia bacterium]
VKPEARAADRMHVSRDAEIIPSGNEAFDRARTYLVTFREDEALDWFEMAATDADALEIRASAAAYAAGLLLSRGRPWEAETWAHIVREHAATPDLGNLLEAAARLQLQDVDGARAILEHTAEPIDPWFPTSPHAAQLLRAHVAYLDGDTERSLREVMAVFDAAPFAPDVWDAFARLCAETDFDPTPVMALVPDDRTLEVLAALRSSEPAGVERIAELIWARNPGDARVLALVPSFAGRLDAFRAMEWSARKRAAGMGRLCPLLERGEDLRVGAPERARCAALAHASFGDRRARDVLEKAVPALTDDELTSTLAEVWGIAPMLADSAVVTGATSTLRSLRIAAVLQAGGATAEAYAVLVHGLSMEDAEGLTTEQIVELLPLATLQALAAEAEARGELDVAGILEAVAVVSNS